MRVVAVSLAEAYSIAKDRAWSWGGDDCTAAWAWEGVAVRRRTCVTDPAAYSEAMADLDASDDEAAVAQARLAVQTIARADVARVRRAADTPRNRRTLAALIRAARLTDEVAA